MLHTRKQTDCSSLLLAAALLGASISPSASSAQNIEQLPANYRVSQLERLPRTDESPSLDGPRLEAQTRLRFARGGIELQVPDGWWTEEVPFGREIRLMVVPRRPATFRKMPIDGMWMAYHAATAGESQGEATLSRELSQRLRMVVAGNSQFSPPTPFSLGAWPAVSAEFTSRDPSSSNVSIAGRHVLVRTDWGIFEFHASAPTAIVEARSTHWTTTWESLRLSPPGASNDPAPNSLGQSNGIIGDWKSYRSRMRFSSDGRVVILPDAVGSNRNSNPLTGTFELRDDLIFVRWDDGSRLNFRSRLQGNDLFLTDHVGQISHLKRVFN